MSREIPLQNAPGVFALVDDYNYRRFARYRWYLHKAGYAARFVRSHRENPPAVRILYMHRLVLGVSAGPYRHKMVDHIDGNPLNNLRDNLRTVTPSQNARNRHRLRASKSSQFKGVYFDRTVRSSKRWKAQIVVEGKVTHIGRYGTENEAAQAYDQAALAHFGLYAAPNFNPSGAFVLQYALAA